MAANRVKNDLERAAVIVYGTSVPADGSKGYRKGCFFIDTDAAAGSVAFINEGTEASSDFNSITVT